MNDTNCARRRAGFDDAVAAVDDRQRDGEAAERLHHRTGAIADPRHLVGFVLDRGDVDRRAVAASRPRARTP